MKARQIAQPGVDAIFDQYFLVRIRYLQSRSIESMRVFGTRVSELEELNVNRDKEEITTEMSVDMMFEKWRSGVTVRLLRYEDSAKVYRIIQEHIATWADYLSKGHVNTGDAPLKDLIELDLFAAAVYDKAVNVFSEAERTTALSNNYLGVQQFNFTNILKRTQSDSGGIRVSNGAEVHSVNGTEEKDLKNGLRDRVSYKDLFGEHVTNVADWSQR